MNWWDGQQGTTESETGAYKVGAATTLEEDTERWEEDGEDDLGRVSWWAGGRRAH